MSKEEYVAKLKAEFAASEKYSGYDPDEDPGYFLQWVLDRLYRVENP